MVAQVDRVLWLSRLAKARKETWTGLDARVPFDDKQQRGQRTCVVAECGSWKVTTIDVDAAQIGGVDYQKSVECESAQATQA